MSVSLAEHVGSADDWDAMCRSFRVSHLLQSYGWGEVKRTSGWFPRRLVAYDGSKPVACIQVLFKGRPPVRFAYVPKGPVTDESVYLPLVLSALEPYCRSEGACVLHADLPFPGPPPQLPPGWTCTRCIQPQATLVVELMDPEEVLARMRPKTRYNLRLAMKKGVKVTARQDKGAVEAFYFLLEETAKRDSFGIHPLTYYMEFWKQFILRDMAVLLLAEVEGRELGGVVAARWGADAYYLYGASASYGRELMASYLLQWEAMRWAHGKGCRNYDLWGVPSDASPNLTEAEIERRRLKEGGLWGVYRFKSGFGGKVVRYSAVRKSLTLPGLILSAVQDFRRR